MVSWKTARTRAMRNLSHWHLCAYCGKKGTENKGPDGKNWHIDHVIPVSRGGTHDLHNLVKACAWCNTSKGTRIINPIDGTPCAGIDEKKELLQKLELLKLRNIAERWRLNYLVIHNQYLSQRLEEFHLSIRNQVHIQKRVR